MNRNVAPPPLIAAGPALLLVALTVTCLVVAWSAWVWRLSRVERDPEDPGPSRTERGGEPALGASEG